MAQGPPATVRLPAFPGRCSLISDETAYRGQGASGGEGGIEPSSKRRALESPGSSRQPQPPKPTADCSCSLFPCFFCPISRSVFVDPVVAEDKLSYERQCIERRVRQQQRREEVPTSPMTREPITLEGLWSNTKIKKVHSRVEGQPPCRWDLCCQLPGVWREQQSGWRR